MTRRQFAWSAAACIGGGLTACSRARDPIRVGILHSLSGSMAIVETSLRDAAMLAVEQINAGGGVLGRIVEPVVEDGSSDPDRFQLLANKLLTADKVCSIFGCWTSSSRKSLLPVLQAHNGLLWYPAVYEGNECSRNVIYTGSAPNQQIIPAVDWLFARGARRFYLIGSDYVYPRTTNRVVSQHLAEIRATVAGEEYVPLDVDEFDGTIRRIRAARPDVVFSTLAYANRSFYRAFTKAGIAAKDLPIMAMAVTEAEIRRIGTMWTEGHLATWAYFQSVDTPENVAFVGKFKERYGERRVTDDPTESAYFQVHVWAEAVRKAGTTDVNAVRESVAGLRFAAPEGPVHIDAENRHTWKTWRVGEVQHDGQFRILSSGSEPLRPDPWNPVLNGGSACDWKTGQRVEPGTR
jgi:urea transport system substrate-binding protein